MANPHVEGKFYSKIEHFSCCLAHSYYFAHWIVCLPGTLLLTHQGICSYIKQSLKGILKFVFLKFVFLAQILKEILWEEKLL